MPRIHALALAALVAVAPLSAQAGIALLNSTDGYVEVPYSPAVVPQSGITVEAWITYDDSTIPNNWSYPTVMRQNRNAGQESFFLRVNADNVNRKILRWFVNVNTRVSVNWTFQPGQLTTWTHVAGTYDGTTARLFVNGVEMASAAGSGALRDAGDVLRIGKGSDVATPIEVWNGSIDEVRIWPFARSAAEITATMNLELATIPGEVSTWNFNNDAVDSSSGRNGTIGGSVNFTSNVPALLPLGFPGAAVGGSTNGCLGNLHATTSSIPRVGNAGFALVGHRFPAGVPTIALLGRQTLAAPFPLVGVDIWINPNTLFGGYPATVDALGTARLPLAIPANISPGAALSVQFVALDPCGPQGLTASNAVAFGILP